MEQLPAVSRPAWLNAISGTGSERRSPVEIVANAASYLERLARTALQGMPDPAIEAARIATGGRLVHPVTVQHARIYGLQP